MAWGALPTSPLEELPVQLDYSVVPQLGLLVSDPPAHCRPRHPETTIFYQIFFEDHFDSYVRAYEERFEPHA